MRRIDDLRPRPCTDLPARLAAHGKDRADRHLDLTLPGHIGDIAFTVYTPVHLLRRKILISELLLHMTADIGHYIILLLLDASPKADRIGILKQHAFIIGIEGQINQKYKDENSPCNDEYRLHRHISPRSLSYKHNTTPIPNNRKGAKGIRRSPDILFTANKTSTATDSDTSAVNRIRKQLCSPT